jgi:hypothetical protein
MNDGMVNECGAVVGMRIDRGKKRYLEKSALVSFSLPQIPHDLNWNQTHATMLGSQ